MRPIAATVEAVDELDAYLDDGTLLDRLVDIGDRVRAVVPDTIGLSVTSTQQGVTFTLVATDEELAVLERVAPVPEPGPTGDDPCDEGSWRQAGRERGEAGMRSTLTLPVLVLGLVRGSVHLYGASDHAYDGHHEEVARICGAWAAGAVTNADLGLRQPTDGRAGARDPEGRGPGRDRRRRPHLHARDRAPRGASAAGDLRRAGRRRPAPARVRAAAAGVPLSSAVREAQRSTLGSRGSPVANPLRRAHSTAWDRRDTPILR